jgi:hypothetical protein
LLSSRRFAPYLSQNENGRPYLDRDKVERAEHLDGKFVLTTNPAGLWGPRTPQHDDTLSVADIARSMHNWRPPAPLRRVLALESGFYESCDDGDCRALSGRRGL